jgi:hypothetical protein
MNKSPPLWKPLPAWPAPSPGGPSLRRRDPHLLAARCCYNHIARRLGVAFADALVRRGYVSISDDDARLTSAGLLWVEATGVPVPKTRTDASRHFRLCLDWTERRFHLAGSIPNAVLHHLLEGGLVVAASKLSSNVTVAGKAWFGQLGSTRRRGQPPNHRHRRELPSVGLRPAAVVILDTRNDQERYYAELMPARICAPTRNQTNTMRRRPNHVERPSSDFAPFGGKPAAAPLVCLWIGDGIVGQNLSGQERTAPAADGAHSEAALTGFLAPKRASFFTMLYRTQCASSSTHAPSRKDPELRLLALPTNDSRRPEQGR